MMRCAVVQMRSGIDVAANVAAMENLVRQAASQGATYIQTPEMTGLVQKSRKELFASISTDENDPTFKAASRLASELNIWLHIGSTPILLSDDKVANRAALFAPSGKRVATYDKIHMFDVDLDNGESWRESAIYRPGHYSVVAPCAEAMLGMAICYDVRFAPIFTQQAQAGVNILSAPACFTRQTGRAHWHVLQRARAIENGAYMISAAQGGDHEDGRETYGHSLIVDPWGEVIAEVEGEEPGIAIADIDLAKSSAARAKVPNLKNARPFEMKIAKDKQ